MRFKLWLNEGIGAEDMLYRLKKMLEQDLPEALKKKLQSLADQLEASEANPTPQDLARIQQDFIHFSNAVKGVGK